MAKLSGLLNDRIGAVGVNKVSHCALGSGDFNKTQMLLNSSGFLLDITDLRITNLDSLFRFALVQPVQGDHYRLHNEIGLGECSALGTCRLLGLQRGHCLTPQ
jgi:hypothetical protein